MSEDLDQWNPQNFIVSDAEVAELKQQSSANGQKRRKAKREIDFYQFPEAVLQGILKTNYLPTLVLAMAVYKAWYDDFEKKNPVKLTTKRLEGFDLSPFQKSRGLKKLESTGQFIIERFPGSAPVVTMKWKEIRN